MKKLAPLALLAAVALVQTVRIERVAATPAVAPPAVDSPAADPPAAASSSEPKATPDAAPTPAHRREYVEAKWPRYVIEPPDILSIEGIRLAPKKGYRIEPFDALHIRAAGALPDHPIDDAYAVDAQGSVNFGPPYGRIPVAGLTIDQGEVLLREQLAKTAAEVKVALSLSAPAGVQQVTGQHLVAMDGRVNLGIYGSVFVAGLTLEQARDAIERHLSRKLDRPEVAVDVLAYNSKVYYVIAKGGDEGDNVVRMPITGNETVLDAVANLGGVAQASVAKMWVTRPPVDGRGQEQILPVAWNEIATGSSTATNYQLLPGDRLFIERASADRSPTKDAPAAPRISPLVLSDLGTLQFLVDRDATFVLVDRPVVSREVKEYKSTVMRQVTRTADPPGTSYNVTIPETSTRVLETRRINPNAARPSRILADGVRVWRVTGAELSRAELETEFAEAKPVLFLLTPPDAERAELRAYAALLRDDVLLAYIPSDAPPPKAASGR